jgi:hypothetical protein
MSRKYWDTVTKEEWSTKGYPWRPQTQDLCFLESVTAKDHVLLLGVTPEIRKILNSKNIKVTCVDYSVNAIREMSALFGGKQGSNETLVKDDWLTFKINEKFDVIIGDLVLNLVDPRDYIRLRDNLIRHLQEGGRCYFRTLAKDTDTHNVEYSTNNAFLWVLKKSSFSVFSFAPNMVTKLVAVGVFLVQKRVSLGFAVKLMRTTLLSGRVLNFFPTQKILCNTFNKKSIIIVN